MPKSPARRRQSWRSSWGDVHRAYFDHLSGRKKTGHDVDGVGTAGDLSTVNTGEGRWTASRVPLPTPPGAKEPEIYEHLYGASMRMVVVLSKPVEIYATLADPEDLEMFERWKRCELWPRENLATHGGALGLKPSPTSSQRQGEVVRLAP